MQTWILLGSHPFPLHDPSSPFERPLDDLIPLPPFVVVPQIHPFDDKHLADNNNIQLSKDKIAAEPKTT